MGSKTENVITQEIPKAPDESVITTDAVSVETKPAKPDAAASDKTDSSNSPDSATGDQDKTTKRTNFADRKIKKLQRQLSEALEESTGTKAELAEMRAELAEIRGSLTTQSKAPEPKFDDFKTPQEYAKAYAEWEADQKAPARKQPASPKQPAAKPAKPDPPQVPEDIAAFQKKGKEKLGDEFMEALTDKVAVNQYMAEYMMDHDLGPEIYVHLANNPDESKKIFSASPYRAQKALDALAEKAKAGQLDVGHDGQLKVEDNDTDEDEQEEQEQKPAAREKRTETKAPKPPSSTKETGGGSAKKDLDNMSMDEYAEHRRQQEMKRSRF